MKRFTTPHLTFSTPFLATSVEEAYITFRQGAKTVLEKSTEDGLVVSDYSLSLDLTQEETGKFAPNGAPLVEIQGRVKLVGGDVAASNIIEREIGRVLKGGVI